MNIYGDGTQSFSESLRNIRKDGERTRELLREHADEIGGSPDLAPLGWNWRKNGIWADELARRYMNIAEYEGWETLPGYIPTPRPE